MKGCVVLPTVTEPVNVTEASTEKVPVWFSATTKVSPDISNIGG